MKGEITITTGTLVRAMLVLLAVIALFALRDLLLVVLTAVVIASSIDPAARWLVQYRLPRAFAVVVVYFAVGASFFGLLFFFVPHFLSTLSLFLGTLPSYLDSLNTLNPLKDSTLFGTTDLSQTFSLRNTVTEFQSSLSSISGSFFQTVQVVFGGVVSFVLIIVLSFYFSVQEKSIEDFIALVTPLAYEKRMLDLWARSKAKIARWMQGQLLLGVIVGVLVFLGLSILGVRFALLFALLAGFLEIIPLFGPTLAAVAPALLAFSDGGLTLGLLVIGLFVIIQQFENHLIYPLVVTKVVGVPPVLIIIALVAGAKLAGFLGVLLAVPAAAIIQEIAGEIKVARTRHLSEHSEGG